MKKNSRIRIAKELFPYLKPYKKQYLAICILKYWGLVLGLILPLFYKLLINDVIINRKWNIFFLVILGYVSIYLLETVAEVAGKYMRNQLFLKMILSIKKKILGVYMRMKYSEYESYNVGDLKNRIEDDTKKIEIFWEEHCLNFIYAVTNIIVIAIVMLVLNRLLAIWGIVMVFFSFAFSKFMSRRLEKIAEKERELQGEYNGFLFNSLQNWKEIKSSNLIEIQGQSLSEKWRCIADIRITHTKYKYFHTAFIVFKDMFITKMFTYFLGGIMIINDIISVADLLVFMTYYEIFFRNITICTDLIISLKEEEPLIHRVLEILQYPVMNKPNGNLKGDIEFKNVSFRYDKSSNLVLNYININMKQNTKVAIVGESGGGKTTIAKLLLGLYEPNEGKIYIGGEDINQFRSSRLNCIVGAVMQDPFFFNGTIDENLRLAKKNITREEMDDICKKAHIFDFIDGLPQKYQTIIGERGVKLSGGQKQRLAIARTLLLNPEIIVFDEATSSLDSENEKHILEAVQELSVEKTIIMIAHRLSTIVDADDIFVINHGELIARGCYQTLVAANIIKV